METKLTTVSIVYEGKRASVFVALPVVNGKVHVDEATLKKILSDHGIELRPGSTFTIGG